MKHSYRRILSHTHIVSIWYPITFEKPRMQVYPLQIPCLNDPPITLHDSRNVWQISLVTLRDNMQAEELTSASRG